MPTPTRTRTQTRQVPSRMAESPASATEKRTVRFCENRRCGSPLPEKARKGRKYCNARCRAEASRLQAHEGRVRSVNRLSSGLYSVTYYIKETSRRPGDIITENP